MKTLLINIIVFLFTVFLFSGVYFLLNMEEVQGTQNYDFIIFALIGGSAVFVVPHLLQKWAAQFYLFLKKK